MKFDLKYPAAYLPYGVMLICPVNNQKVPTKLDVFNLRHYDYEHDKLVLHPLSDLTESIYHKEEWLNIEKALQAKIEDLGGSARWNAEEVIRCVRQEKGYDVIPHGIYQDMIKWHMDIFHLIPAGYAVSTHDIEKLNDWYTSIS